MWGGDYGVLTQFMDTLTFVSSIFFNLKFYLFIYGCAGSSLFSGLSSSCGKPKLLSDFGAWASRGSGVSYCASRALEHRLSSCGVWVSCSAARGIFPDQGLNLCLLHWPVDSWPLSYQGSPCFFVYCKHALCTGEGDGTPVQYSCLENPMDGGAW